MAKKRIVKKKVDINGLITIFLFIALIGVIVYGGMNDWFNLDILVQNEIENMETLEERLEDPDSDSQCTLSLSESEICSGDSVTGTLTDGENTNCWIFADDGTGWKSVYNGATNADGVWRETNTISTLGSFDFRGVCDLDGDGAFNINNDCVTNQRSLDVVACADPPSPPPSYSDDEEVGAIDGGLNMGNGVNAVEQPIDLGDFPATGTGEGCKLKAQINTQWSYLTPETCTGIQASEAMHFSLRDSDSLEWERTDTVPVGLGEETACGLDWDGVTPWVFKAEKVLELYQCQIQLDYDVSVKTCECTD